jgi:hypothetical protein
MKELCNRPKGCLSVKCYLIGPRAVCLTYGRYFRELHEIGAFFRDLESDNWENVIGFSHHKTSQIKIT